MRAIPITATPATAGEVTVLVEDELTSVLLTEVFVDKRFDFRPAGGSWPLQGVLHPTSKVVPGALGVVDRDFGPDNFADWTNPNKKLQKFILPVHEAENLLLDFRILAALSGTESEIEIRKKAETRARELVYWLACKSQVAAIQRTVGQGFPSASPPEPPTGISSVAGAVKHIYDDAAYWTSEPGVLASWTREEIEKGLVDRVAGYESDIASAKWTETFSGKEIVHHLRSKVRNLDRSAPDVNGRQRDVDVAHRVAQAMRADPARIPACLVTLYAALCSRCGLPPHPQVRPEVG